MTYDDVKTAMTSAVSELTIDTVGRAIVGALTEAELNLLKEAIEYHARKIHTKV